MLTCYQNSTSELACIRRSLLCTKTSNDIKNYS